MPNLAPGDVVLLVEDELARCDWRLGRVVSCKESADGGVRSATVDVGTTALNKRGVPCRPLTRLERPIHKLVLLLSEGL